MATLVNFKHQELGPGRAQSLDWTGAQSGEGSVNREARQCEEALVFGAVKRKHQTEELAGYL